MIPQAHHWRVIVLMTATLRTAAVAGRLSGAGLIVAGRLLAGLLLLHPRLLGPGLAHGARGAGGAILAGGSGGAGLAHFTGLLVVRQLRRRFGAGEAFGPCG